MEKRKNVSDPFWSSTQAGFEFDDKVPQVIDSEIGGKGDHLNELHLLTCSGLTEAAEKNACEKSSTFKLPPVGPNSHLFKVTKISKSIDNQQKIQSTCVNSEIQQTVKKMILGSDYSLTKFKKHNEKSELLKEAVNSYDGNVILEVVLFLKETLKKSLFQRELVAHPDAVNVYLAYLEENHEVDELSNILLFMGETEDAAMFKYEVAISIENPERKLKWIENCLSTHFQPGATDFLYQQSVEEHKKLLSDQLSLKCTSPELEPTSHFEKLCGRNSVIDSSVLCTIIFCFLHFYKTDEVRFSMAEKIKKNFNLSKKQFMWAALRALSVSHRWQDVDSLFIGKSWLLSGLKLRSCIPVSKILEVFFEANAPKDVLSKYISCIENEQEKLQYAKKYECHNIAIEIFKNNKDRQELIKYQSSLVPHMDDFLYALKVLNDSAIRWKN